MPTLEQPLCQEMLPKTKDAAARPCGKPLHPFNVHSYPPASEWYCPRCHSSTAMDKETTLALNGAEEQNMKQKG